MDHSKWYYSQFVHLARLINAKLIDYPLSQYDMELRLADDFLMMANIVYEDHLVNINSIKYPREWRHIQ